MSNQLYRETIKDPLGADCYNVSLRGTKWRKGIRHYDSEENVIASILCEKNGVYVVTCDVITAACPSMHLTFPSMDKATETLISTLKFLGENKTCEAKLAIAIEALREVAFSDELAQDVAKNALTAMNEEN
jgi:hypothetical protein